MLVTLMEENMSYEFPEVRPHDDAEFTTDKNQFVMARAVGIRLSMSGRAERPDQIDIVFVIQPAQRALRAANPKAGIQAGHGDVAGWTVWKTGSLNGEAPAITMADVRKAGLDPAKLHAAYGDDPEWLSIKQQVAGLSQAEQDHVISLLAIQRGGDPEKSGFGSTTVELGIWDDTFGGVTRRRCNVVRAQQRAATLADVLSLGLSTAAKATAPRAKADAAGSKTGTSAPPKGVAKDNVDDF
jgi:hypothetical protein